jgi:hypothetical protein
VTWPIEAEAEPAGQSMQTEAPETLVQVAAGQGVQPSESPRSPVKEPAVQSWQTVWPGCKLYEPGLHCRQELLEFAFGRGLNVPASQACAAHERGEQKWPRGQGSGFAVPY